MKSKTFIIKKLQDLANIFEYLTFKYEYDADNRCHFIEVNPSEIRGDNWDYIELERKIYLDFFDLFPNEDIAFLSLEHSFDFEQFQFIKQQLSSFCIHDYNEIDTFYNIPLTNRQFTIGENENKVSVELYGDMKYTFPKHFISPEMSVQNLHYSMSHGISKVSRKQHIPTIAHNDDILSGINNAGKWITNILTMNSQKQCSI